MTSQILPKVKDCYQENLIIYLRSFDLLYPKDFLKLQWKQIRTKPLAFFGELRKDLNIFYQENP